jgi:hypothetical protein
VSVHPFAPHTTIEQFLSGNPARARLLQKLQIDFFCRTDRTLVAACADVDLDFCDFASAVAEEEAGE